MFCLVALLHVAALVVMAATEADWVAKTAFLLVWGLLNFFWLALFRRPAVAGLLSLEFVVALTLLSRFKFDKLWMTVDFVDLMSSTGIPRLSCWLLSLAARISRSPRWRRLRF